MMIRRLFIGVLITAAAGLRARSDEPVVIAKDAIQPQVAIDGDGGAYVVFIHKGNICVAVSSDKGKTFSSPSIAMDVKGRATGGAQRGPRIGVDAKKKITVTAPVSFDDAEYAKKYPTAELYLVTSSDGGKTWTKPLQVNEASKKAPEALHWMVVAPSGEAHVAWLDLRGRLQPGQDLYYAKVSNGKVSKNEKIASTVCECCAPGLAIDALRAQPVVAWREGGDKIDGRNILVCQWIGQAYKERVNSTRTNLFVCPMSAPAIAVSTDGKKLVTAWMDERGGKEERRIYFKSADWKAPESRISPVDEPIDPSSSARQDHPAVAFDASGTAWLAWEQGEHGDRRIWLRTSAKGSKPSQVSDDAHGKAAFPSIAAGGGIVGLVHEAKDGEMGIAVFRRIQ